MACAPYSATPHHEAHAVWQLFVGVCRSLWSGCLCLVLGVFLCGQAPAQTVEKMLSTGPVITAHVKWEHDCANCHQRFDKGAQARLCQDCHKDIASDIRSKSRLHGKLNDTNCRTCHTEHKGRDANIAPIDKAKFDHGRTDFKLNGAHKEAATKCESCHQPKVKFRDTPKLCNDCHKKDDQEKGHKGQLGKKCESCHNETKWSDTTFDHSKTKFPLKGGKHAEVKCSGCHEDKTYQKTPTTCVGCHKKLDDDKGHKGRYGSKCESCHNDKSWKESIFNHDQDTHYALKGKHRQVKCSACHQPDKGDLYKTKWPSKCIACHKKDDDEKGHRGDLGDKCETCHNERGWKLSNFDHDTTKFALRDQHKETKCDNCHRGGVSGDKAGKLKLDMACLSCHKKQDDDKGHRGRYGEKCDSCHEPKSWSLGKFDHDKETKYRLKGRHQTVKCDACHTPEKGVLKKTKWDTTCISCHKRDDKHLGQLGPKCESCHDEKQWKGTLFDHNQARYPLTGSHALVACKNCHVTAAFRDAPMTCLGCHKKDDKHKAGFGANCENCHVTTSWKSWDFDHSTTKFALDGGHKKVLCEEFHKPSKTGQMLKTSRLCGSCHQKEDVHAGSFGQNCAQCHVTSSWRSLRR